MQVPPLAETVSVLVLLATLAQPWTPHLFLAQSVGTRPAAPANSSASHALPAACAPSPIRALRPSRGPATSGRRLEAHTLAMSCPAMHSSPLLRSQSSAELASTGEHLTSLARRAQLATSAQSTQMVMWGAQSWHAQRVSTPTRLVHQRVFRVLQDTNAHRHRRAR